MKFNVVVATHHKTGTVWMSSVFAAIAKGLGAGYIDFWSHYGRLDPLLKTPFILFNYDSTFRRHSNILARDGHRVTVRPERIRMLDEGAGVPGTVAEVVYLGSVTRYVVDLDEGGTLVALRQNADTSAAEVLAARGRRVGLAWDPRHAMTLEEDK